MTLFRMSFGRSSALDRGDSLRIRVVERRKVASQNKLGCIDL